MVESIEIKVIRPDVWFGVYPTTHTVHRVKITRSDGVGISLCGKRFKPRMKMKSVDTFAETMCKFCERLAAR